MLKKEGKCRPIEMAEYFLKVVEKYVFLTNHDAYLQAMGPHNAGVGVSGGSQMALHSGQASFG
jgi:hypothetical protein